MGILTKKWKEDQIVIGSSKARLLLIVWIPKRLIIIWAGFSASSGSVLDQKFLFPIVWKFNFCERPGLCYKLKSLAKIYQNEFSGLFSTR